MKILVGISISLVAVALAIQPFPVFALLDVDENSWYAAPVSAFVDQGYLPSNMSFRPSDKATRGEFIELMVSLLGGVKHSPFSGQSFDDVPIDHSNYEAFEEAGIQGWMKGAGSCYGSHPCNGNPNQLINRAEAAALLMRAFGLQEAENVPSFDDNAPNQWFTSHIKGAASLCVLRGDEGAKRVRPSDNMNRAEMIVMLSRTMQRENYPNCSQGAVRPTLPKAPLRNIKNTEASNKTEVEFLREFYKFETDILNKMTSQMSQYEGSMRQELEEILEAFSGKIKEFEKFISLSLDHKLTGAEEAEMTFVAGEINALWEQFNKTKNTEVQNKPKADPIAAKFVESEKQFSQTFLDLIEVTKQYASPTQGVLIEILNAYSERLEDFQRIVDLARTRELTNAEYETAEDALLDMNKLARRFTDTQKADSTQQIYYQTPITPSQPSVSTPQVDCERERRIGNKQGIASDSNWSKYMFEIGCYSLETYCKSRSRYGLSDSRCN